MASTLADSLAAGDPAAFAALYDRLAVRLFNTARTLTSSSADAEDIVHDLFVELARCRERLSGVVDLEAYVFTMLRHAVSRSHRRFAIDRKAVGLIAADRLRAGGCGALAHRGLGATVIRATHARGTRADRGRER